MCINCYTLLPNNTLRVLLLQSHASNLYAILSCILSKLFMSYNLLFIFNTYSKLVIIVIALYKLDSPTYLLIFLFTFLLISSAFQLR